MSKSTGKRIVIRIEIDDDPIVIYGHENDIPHPDIIRDDFLSDPDLWINRDTDIVTVSIEEKNENPKATHP